MLAALVLALGLFACDELNSTPKPAIPNMVRIVSSLPLKGNTAAPSRQMEQAIRLAIDEQKPTLAGLDIEYLELDDLDDETGEWSSAKEAANAKQAADDPSVIAYMGPYNSGAVMISLPVTNRAGMLQVSPSATWPGLTRGGFDRGEPDKYYPTGMRNFVSKMPDNSLQGRVAALWALALGIKEAVVLSDGSTYSSGLADSFEQYGVGMTTLRLEIDPTSLGGFSTQVASAEAIFYAPSSVSNALAVARALNGVQVQVFASDVALDPQFGYGAGTGISRWHIVSNSVPGDQLFGASSGPGASFKAAFENAYGDTPGQFAVNAYDITNRILNALESPDNGNPTALPDRASVLKYVLSTEGLGAGGTIKFTSEGIPAYWRMSGYEWRDGGFKFSRIFEVGP